MSLMADSGEQHTVIDVNQLSSDIEAEIIDSSAKDDEIDLLNEGEIEFTINTSNVNNLVVYKKRYRDLVHALRQLNRKLVSEHDRYEQQEKELRKQIAALQEKRDGHRRQNSDSVSLINVASEGEITGRQGSSKQSSKLRDLERLLSKCKESLKAKNQQLKILKDSLLEVDKFKEYMNGVKDELKDLRQAHETWTLSIAENKRVMHQEIEVKNLEIDKLKAEIKDVQAQLKDSNNKSLQFKVNIQQLESRLVSTSAAHQKERESLTKELVAAKNNAIKQLQRDHDLQLERVKLDLERSIENLKLEVLVKDEQIIRNAERERELQEQNCSLRTELEGAKRKLEDTQKELSDIKSIRDEQDKEISNLKAQHDAIKTQSEDVSGLKLRKEELETENNKLKKRVEELTTDVSSAKHTAQELEIKLDEQKQALARLDKACDRCEELQVQINKGAEQYGQSSFELKTQLELMTTANNDQEKVIEDLKSEREKAIDSYRLLKAELDESTKRNETVSQVVQENETEMQNLQEQLKQMNFTKQQLEAVKRENASLNSSLAQVNNELKEKLDDLRDSQTAMDDLKKRIVVLESEAGEIARSSKELEQEKLSLVQDLAVETKRRKDLEQQLVVGILTAMKNLETPDTSPGSDKIYKPEVNDINSSKNGSNLPDPIKLAADLSSLALDRSNAYVSSNQRLQAAILDNNMINEELNRLKAELKVLNTEKTNEVLTSLEEVDRLRTENQALIHDQKVYDDQVASLEGEIEDLKSQIAEIKDNEAEKSDAATATEDDLINQLQLKEQEIQNLRQMNADKDKALEECQTSVESDDVPDPTEFKYLKNIVYEFMMGREPTTLARVISAVFKFEQEQVEQICRVQEAIHQVTG